MKKGSTLSPDHRAKISFSLIKRFGKGFLYCNKNGRWLVRTRGGGIKHWARIVYQNYVLNGEEIPKRYEVHHKDLNPENDNVDNLELWTKGEHTKIHRKGKLHSEEEKEKIGNFHRGAKRSSEARRKMSEAARKREERKRLLKGVEK